MHSPLGFGKNYFTFSSVLAHSVQNKLQSQIAKVDSLIHKKISNQEDKLEDDDPPIEVLILSYSSLLKACHCNCFYKLKTKLALLINIFIPRCPFYTTCFAFRRTGVHPPQKLLTN